MKRLRFKAPAPTAYEIANVYVSDEACLAHWEWKKSFLILAFPKLEFGQRQYVRKRSFDSDYDDGYSVPERFIKLYMPWKRWAYTISNDGEDWLQPALMLFWNRPHATFLSIRLGYQ